MKVAEAIARVLKEEGIEYLICYPRQALIDFCAEIGIRPIVCRQERVGVGIADGISRSTYGKRIGVFSMQGGPGVENTFPGAAQVFGDNVPVLLIPGDRVGRSFTPPSFDPVQNFRAVIKWAAEISERGRVIELMRRAFHNLRTGKPGPVLIELPSKVGKARCRWRVRVLPAGGVPHGARCCRCAHHRRARAQGEAADHPCRPRRALLRRNQGAGHVRRTHQVPVLTTNTGKGAFPENHPLSLGASVVSAPKTMFHFLKKADCVVAMGSSLTRNHWAPQIPTGKTIIHCTNDPLTSTRSSRPRPRCSAMPSSCSKH